MIASAAAGLTLIGLFCLLLARRARRPRPAARRPKPCRPPVALARCGSRRIHRVRQRQADDPRQPRGPPVAGLEQRSHRQDDAGVAAGHAAIRSAVKYPRDGLGCRLDERVARFDEGGMFEVARASWRVQAVSIPSTCPAAAAV